MGLAEFQHLRPLRAQRRRDEQYRGVSGFSVCCSESGNRTMAVTKEGLHSEEVVTGSNAKAHRKRTR